jgi:hypothetical protein
MPSRVPDRGLRRISTDNFLDAPDNFFLKQSTQHALVPSSYHFRHNRSLSGRSVPGND